MLTETEGALLKVGQLIEEGLSSKVISWLRRNRWEVRERKPGTGTEDFILVAPTNEESMPLVVQIRTWREPADKVIIRKDVELWLQKPKAWNEFDRRPLVEINDCCPDDEPRVSLSISKLIPSSRGRERWLQIQGPREEVYKKVYSGLEQLNQIMQRTILLSPNGTEWQEVIKGYTPHKTHTSMR